MKLAALMAAEYVLVPACVKVTLAVLLVVSPIVPVPVIVPPVEVRLMLEAEAVTMDAPTEMLLAAVKSTEPLVKLIGLETVNVLDAPVIVAVTLPVPLMLLSIVVVAARLNAKVALLDKVTALAVPSVPVEPALPICKVPPLTEVAPE